MKADRSIPAATVTPILTYPDVRQAVAWLSAAFGFVERVRIGEAHRAQLRFGDGALTVADPGEWLSVLDALARRNLRAIRPAGAPATSMKPERAQPALPEVVWSPVPCMATDRGGESDQR